MESPSSGAVLAEREKRGEQLWKILEDQHFPSVALSKVVGMVMELLPDNEELDKFMEDHVAVGTQAERAREVLEADPEWQAHVQQVAQWEKEKQPKFWPTPFYYQAFFDHLKKNTPYAGAWIAKILTSMFSETEETQWVQWWLRMDQLLQTFHARLEGVRVEEGEVTFNFALDTGEQCAGVAQSRTSSRYSMKMCKYYKRGTCRRGAACRYVHQLWENLPNAESSCPTVETTEAGDASGVASNDNGQLPQVAIVGPGKGASKGFSTSGKDESICWRHANGFCKFGGGCKFAHSDSVTLDTHREAGRTLDDHARSLLQKWGMNGLCFEYQLDGTCGRGGESQCKFDHRQIPETQRMWLRDVLQKARQRRRQAQYGEFSSSTALSGSGHQASMGETEAKGGTHEGSGTLANGGTYDAISDVNHPSLNGGASALSGTNECSGTLAADGQRDTSSGSQGGSGGLLTDGAPHGE